MNRRVAYHQAHELFVPSLLDIIKIKLLGLNRTFVHESRLISADGPSIYYSHLVDNTELNVYLFLFCPYNYILRIFLIQQFYKLRI